MRPKPAHPVQEDFDFLILLNILFILYTAETRFKGYCIFCLFVFAILRCSVLFWF